MATFRHTTAAALLLALLTSWAYAQPSATPWTPPSYGDDYIKTWRDGNAELASYTLTYPRYGELRTGTAVMITVTEPFNPSARVKADTARSDTYNVIKLNLVEDFQTGIYDYNLMTSVFVATESANSLPAGTATKVSFSSQEWCGHVYQQALFGIAPGVTQTSHSYFEGEADQQIAMAYPPGGIAEDAMILWARQLAGPTLQPGESVDVPVYRAMAIQRLLHAPAKWDQATLSVREHLTELRTTAGERFTVQIYDATLTSDVGDRQYTFYIDARPGSHRQLIKMTRDDGYQLERVSSERLPYWRLHNNADERELKKIGLHRRQPGAM